MPNRTDNGLLLFSFGKRKRVPQRVDYLQHLVPISKLKDIGFLGSRIRAAGKVKRAKAFKSHILTKKDTKRTRRLRAGGYADVTNESAIKKMIPYK